MLILPLITCEINATIKDFIFYEDICRSLQIRRLPYYIFQNQWFLSYLGYLKATFIVNNNSAFESWYLTMIGMRSEDVAPPSA